LHGQFHLSPDPGLLRRGIRLKKQQQRCGQKECKESETIHTRRKGTVPEKNEKGDKTHQKELNQYSDNLYNICFFAGFHGNTQNAIQLDRNRQNSGWLSEKTERMG
jgi:hypothetical protein